MAEKARLPYHVVTGSLEIGYSRLLKDVETVTDGELNHAV